MTDSELIDAIARVPYFYHRIELRPGIVTPGWAPIDPGVYCIPDRLDGERVLDVGAWDGYWTFEAIRRGASSLAIDDFSDTCGSQVDANRGEAWATFDLCRSALSDAERRRCRRIECDIQRPNALDGMKFDRVFCFGVLYHLKHPLFALENMRSMCSGTIHIVTAILDNCQSAYDATRGYDGSECVAEFYPCDEYGKNHSNWHVGTLRYWAALVQAAGFRNIETWKLTDTPSCVAECRGFIRAVA